MWIPAQHGAKQLHDVEDGKDPQAFPFGRFVSPIMSACMMNRSRCNAKREASSVADPGVTGLEG